MKMKNSYFLNSSMNVNPVVSLDLDTSWAAKTWDLSQWYLKDPSKIRLKKPGADVQKDNERGGKVRQLFEERRVAGRDKSYPLEPLKHRVVSLDRINYNGEEHLENREYQTRSHKVTSSTNQLPDLAVFRKLPNIGGNLFSSFNQELSNNRPPVSGNNSYKEMDTRRSVKKDVTTTEISSLSKSMRTMKVGNINQNIIGENIKATNKRPTEIVKSKIAKPSSPSIMTARTAPSVLLRSSTLSPKNSAAKTKTSVPTPAPKTSAPVGNRIKSPTINTVNSAPKTQVAKEPIKNRPPPQDGRKECLICNRFFLPDRIATHEKICKKAKTKKRKTFDPVKHRVQGTEAESYLRQAPKQVQQQPARPKLNWKQKHEEFISAIRAAKEAQAYVAKGGKLSDLPPPPPSDTSHYTPCPHCGRKFNETAAARHIPKCADMKHNKPKPQTKTATRISRIK